MKGVDKHAYQTGDFDRICRLMTDVYEIDWRNGVPAPFFENAHGAPWMERDKCSLHAIWERDTFWKGFGNVTTRPKSVFSRISPMTVSGLDVVVENACGEYVSCAGMYLVPEIHLAYLEPLATLEAYRNRGIGSAVLSEMYRRTKALGATHMTGGYSRFYRDLGFLPLVVWTSWEKRGHRF